MSIAIVLNSRNALPMSGCYKWNMAIPRHDWYLKQWLKTLGRTQQWVADELGCQKSEISRKSTGTTPYNRDDINSISALLNLKPYELLLPPEEAYRIVRHRQEVEQEAIRLVAEKQMDFRPAPAELFGARKGK
jgi:transcriptional regulator with XRE-family HTH domain